MGWFMAYNALMLSSEYRTFLDEYQARHVHLVFQMTALENGTFFCGLSYPLESGAWRQARGIAGTPDQAFLLAYATLGMNLQIW